MIPDLLSKVSGVVKKKAGQGVTIDSLVFKLHYRFTLCIILASCILLQVSTLVGSPIQCICDYLGDDKRVPDKVLNSYCWIHSTFSVKKHWGKEIGDQVPYHGVGPHLTDRDNVVYRAYYQWVPLVLFLQAMSFLLPHYLWKALEGGKIKSLLSGMVLHMEKEEERNGKVSRMVDYIMKTSRTNNLYALSYHLCELLNLFVVVANIYFTDYFLGGVFLAYGVDVLNFLNSNDILRTDPMIKLFPRVTKCTLHKYGLSGTIENVDAMCVMAQNILNEKIYIALWLWFVLLATLTTAFLIYKVATFLMQDGRLLMLQRGVPLSHGSNHEHLRTIVERTDLGDFFLIYHLAKNLDLVTYKQFVSELAARLAESFKPGDDLPLISKPVE